MGNSEIRDKRGIGKIRVYLGIQANREILQKRNLRKDRPHTRRHILPQNRSHIVAHVRIHIKAHIRNEIEIHMHIHIQIHI